ncbi:MAG TPA: hypothetical protein VGO09_10535 [Flavisolibacter sp.]|nr:hypothetical protein [Flavisolibacter sp.]
MMWSATAKKEQVIVFVLAILATFIPVAVIELKVLHYTSGFFIYPLDDTFIHMQLARNLAIHHTWGININQFGSASSSLFYTTLLAVCFSLFNVHTIIPFIINCIAGILLLIVIQKWLVRQAINLKGQLIIIGLIIFLTPLPTLIMSGMEHTLQCLFSLLFIISFSDWLNEYGEQTKQLKINARVIIYGFLTVAIRYEGMFIIAIAILILLWRRNIRQAVLLGFISFLPVIVFGIYSISKGGFFLPNSVLVKSETIQLSIHGLIKFISGILIEKLTFSRAGIAPLAIQRLLILLPLIYLIFRNKLRVNGKYFIILVIVFGCTVLHMALAATGWFYRYEAYLVLLGTLIISFLIIKFFDRVYLGEIKATQIVTLILFFFLSFPLLLRSLTAFSKAPRSCINIYEQQLQMSRFSKRYYNTDVIAANDIGAVSFYTDARILDLWGLANNEVAKSRKLNYWTPDFLDSLSKAKNASIAIVYDKWFSDSLLKRWSKVATWQIQNNVVCGDSIVSFYSIDSSKKSSLKANLLNYQSHLPSDVKVTYTEHK